MDSKEIMIGDWVNFLIDIEGGDTDYDPKVAQYQPMKVVSLSSWYNNDGEVESAEGVINDIDQVKPIPLTPEILEQNGFTVFLDFKDLVYYESDDKRIKATNSEGMKNTFNEWSIHVDTKDMRTMAYGEVTYVHEFQHLLRLCGIDKEIEI